MRRKRNRRTEDSLNSYETYENNYYDVFKHHRKKRKVYKPYTQEYIKDDYRDERQITNTASNNKSSTYKRNRRILSTHGNPNIRDYSDYLLIRDKKNCRKNKAIRRSNAIKAQKSGAIKHTSLRKHKRCT